MKSGLLPCISILAASLMLQQCAGSVSSMQGTLVDFIADKEEKANICEILYYFGMLFASSFVFFFPRPHGVQRCAGSVSSMQGP